MVSSCCPSKHNSDLINPLQMMLCMDFVHAGVFPLLKCGEARAWSNLGIVDVYQKISRSQLFDELPDELSDFKQWLPGFKLTESDTPYVIGSDKRVNFAQIMILRYSAI